MKENVDRIRLNVFYIWFATLLVIIAVFGVRLATMPLPFSSMFQSFQMIVGLVLPQISIMVTFYFSLEKQQEKINSLSAEQVRVIILLSLLYHGLFILCLVFGIGFHAFDSHADGEMLQRNTAAIVAVMGLFSVLLVPVTFLFATPAENKEPVEPS